RSSRGRGGLRGRGLGRRRGTIGAAIAGGESLPQPAGHRGLDGGGGGLHELALLLELREDGLAVDTELFGEFVYAGFAWHGSPLVRPAARPLDLVASPAWSSLGLHGWLIRRRPA